MNSSGQTNKKNVWLIIIGFILLLALLRMAWMTIFVPSEAGRPAIEEGLLDLSDTSIIDGQTVNLDGEWRFFPNRLSSDLGEAYSTVDVPGQWSESLAEEDSSVAYGTYELTILVDPDQPYTYSLHFPSIRNASALFVNGQQVEQSGTIATSRADYVAKNLPYTATFSPNEDGVITIQLQAANHLNPSDGGIVRSVKFGETSQVLSENQSSYTMQLIIFVAFVLCAIYAVSLFFINDRNWSFIQVSLLLFGAIVTHSLGSDEKLLAVWLDLDYLWNLKLANAASVGLVFALWLLVKNTSLTINQNAQRIIAYLTIVLTIAIFAMPVQSLEQLQGFFSLFFIVALVLAIILLFKNQNKNSVWMQLALIALLNSYIWWGIWNIQGINTYFYPIDLLVTIGCFTMMWIIQYVGLYKNSQEQAHRLRKISDEKDEFLVKTSHELRNPLHSMLNLTQTTIERNKDRLDQRSVKELETVLISGNRLSLLLDDLFEIANLKITKPTISPSPFRLQSIVGGVLDMFRYTINENKVQLVNRVPDDVPVVQADQNRIIQVLYNLLHNSVKYTDEGEITVNTRVENDKVVVTISDTGVGMDEETVQQIFDPYHQGRNTRNQSEGFGLGLNISKQLVELHGEEISIDSEKNKGTIARFTLPISEEEIPEISSAVKPFLPKKYLVEPVQGESDDLHSKILIIDDDLVNLNVIESVLSEENYELMGVQHVEEFMDYLDNEQWDLLIIDVMMPRMSGYDLTRKIRERYNQTELPILLLTARNHPNDIDTGFRVGANDYISKPVETKELRARVRHLTNLKKMTQEQLALETRWLQAQIRPHFIFNTLNTINALSMMDAAKTQKLIDEFSKFLRNKFDFDAAYKWITVDEEVSIVRSYLYIQQVRFGDKLDVRWEIGDIEGFQLPALTIQPIVENAIQHGIMKQPDGGRIEIKVFRKIDYLRIIIKDDGVGMEDSVIQSIEDHETKGVGLLNTNKRLIKHFGEGLKVRSKQGIGTVIAFNINSFPTQSTGGGSVESRAHR